ncbi:MAG: glutamate--tRNA ligase [Deltaproteobacteria bacterium]|jgi:glutamyl-tRNA synthetase|nr:glutamate--tRNA ligase [Deltaproteobacteria bacterium]
MITRFAPSPTGHLHIGGARTALFNFLLARHNKGRFVLRIEDTDATRSTQEYTDSILSAMEWLGLSWDGDPIFQTSRTDIYRQYVQKLLSDGQAYWCHCRPEDIAEIRAKAQAQGGKPRYDGKCREKNLGPAPGAVVRFKTPPEGNVYWSDLIKGSISIDSSELDDLVILRSDGLPTYNFAVVIDDMTMGITDIIRGDDHVNNTPRQILLYKAFGAKLPAFGHVPMILGADKTRLSKRHGATSVMAYKEMGFLPQALNNYLARLGWSHGDQEIFSLEEMISLFDLKHVGKSAAIFNPEKLTWLNAHYIKQTPLPQLASLMWPYLAAKGYERPNQEKLNKIITTVRERGKTLEELAQKSEFYFVETVEIAQPENLVKLLSPNGREMLCNIGQKLLEHPHLDRETFDIILRDLAANAGVKVGAVAQPLRLALTGSTASPGLFDILEILSPETVQKRIKAALSLEASS